MFECLRDTQRGCKHKMILGVITYDYILLEIGETF